VGIYSGNYKAQSSHRAFGPATKVISDCFAIRFRGKISRRPGQTSPRSTRSDKMSESSIQINAVFDPGIRVEAAILTCATSSTCNGGQGLLSPLVLMETLEPPNRTPGIDDAGFLLYS
jgi:hypothetical protein